MFQQNTVKFIRNVILGADIDKKREKLCLRLSDYLDVVQRNCAKSIFSKISLGNKFIFIYFLVAICIIILQ